MELNAPHRTFTGPIRLEVNTLTKGEVVPALGEFRNSVRMTKLSEKALWHVCEKWIFHAGSCQFHFKGADFFLLWIVHHPATCSRGQ